MTKSVETTTVVVVRMSKRCFNMLQMVCSNIGSDGYDSDELGQVFAGVDESQARSDAQHFFDLGPA